MKDKVTIFVSYSHQNDEWLFKDEKKNLIPWLSAQLKDQAIIWTDYELQQSVGEEYSEIIAEKISNSQIAVLLLSQDFVSSDYIMNTELPLIKKLYCEQKIKLIPILVTNLTNSGREKIKWLFDLQMYPSESKPLIFFLNDSTQWYSQRVSILDVIEKKINDVNKQNSLIKEKPVVKDFPQTGQKKTEPEKPLITATKPIKNQTNKRNLIIIVVSIIMVSAIAIILFLNSNKSKEDSGKATVKPKVEQDSLQINQDKQIVSTNKTKNTPSETQKNALKSDTQIKKNSCIYVNGNKYVGTIKNNVPDGRGYMIFSSRQLIADINGRMIYSSTDDSLYGKWNEGELEIGTLYNKVGEKIESIVVGRY